MLYLPACSTQGSCQVSFPWYPQIALCRSLNLWISSSWGLPLHIMTYYWYHQANRFLMVFNKYFVSGDNLHLFYPILMTMWCSSQIGGTLPLPITRRIPQLHWSIRFLETSHLPWLQRISGYIFPLSDHSYDPLLRLAQRKDDWSEINQSTFCPWESVNTTL